MFLDPCAAVLPADRTYLPTAPQSRALLSQSCSLSTQRIVQVRDAARIDLSRHLVLVDYLAGGAVALDGEQGAEEVGCVARTEFYEGTEGSEAAANGDKD